MEYKNELNELKKMGVPIINSNTNFWFVRTNSGEYYNIFKQKEIISIGWESLGKLEEIEKMSKEQLKKKVTEVYKDNKRPGYVASQVMTFINTMKAGDYIIIPSKDSEYFSFGIIETDAYEARYSEFEKYLDESDIDFNVITKRRKVRWLSEIKRSTLDPHLYRIIYSHNTIVNANEYSTNILSTLFDMYVYEDNFYGNIRIGVTEEISGLVLTRLMYNVIDICKLISKDEIDEEDISMKVNLNSPGIIVIATGMIGIAFALSIVVSIFSGADIDAKLNLLGEFKIHSQGLIKAIQEYNSTKTKLRLEEKKLEYKHIKEKLEIEPNNISAIDHISEQKKISSSKD